MSSNTRHEETKDIEYRISLKLTADSDHNVNFECMVCLQLVDVDDACECLECEDAICKRHYTDLVANADDQTVQCPKCKAVEGFKKKLSKKHRANILQLQFSCPNQKCGLILQYVDAKDHTKHCLK